MIKNGILLIALLSVSVFGLNLRFHDNPLVGISTSPPESNTTIASSTADTSYSGISADSTVEAINEDVVDTFMSDAFGDTGEDSDTESTDGVEKYLDLLHDSAEEEYSLIIEENFEEFNDETVDEYRDEVDELYAVLSDNYAETTEKFVEFEEAYNSAFEDDDAVDVDEGEQIGAAFIDFIESYQTGNQGLAEDMQDGIALLGSSE